MEEDFWNTITCMVLHAAYCAWLTEALPFQYMQCDASWAQPDARAVEALSAALAPGSNAPWYLVAQFCPGERLDGGLSTHPPLLSCTFAQPDSSLHCCSLGLIRKQQQCRFSKSFTCATMICEHSTRSSRGCFQMETMPSMCATIVCDPRGNENQADFDRHSLQWVSSF